MNKTPQANQIQIGIFGLRNAGKSTLMNQLLRQNLSIVSSVPGTTTDSVSKSIEFHPLGPVVFIDTPGVDDEGELGKLRVEKALKIFSQVDGVLWVTKGSLSEIEKDFLIRLKELKKPFVVIHNCYEKEDKFWDQSMSWDVEGDLLDEEVFEAIKQAIVERFKVHKESLAIGDCIQQGEVVLLIMPQDLQAPKGRLILPQVQIIREILDAKGIPILTTFETLDETLKALNYQPAYAITDSQIFEKVYSVLGKSVKLTSFSILMARKKGGMQTYLKGIERIKELKDKDQILVAESCIHNPLHQDIAREQIPKLLQKHTKKELQYTWSTGKDFPDDLNQYKLIIQCGGCMETPMQLQCKRDLSREQQVPITNFGMILAYMQGILRNIWIPK